MPSAPEFDVQNVVVIDGPPGPDLYEPWDCNCEWMRDLHFGSTHGPDIRVGEWIRTKRHRQAKVEQRARLVAAGVGGLAGGEIGCRVARGGPKKAPRAYLVARAD